MEWLALFVPATMAIWLWRKYPDRVVWWELLLPTLFCLISIGTLRWVAHSALTADTEFWTGYAVQSEFHEEWVERVEDTETYTDSDGNTRTRTVVRYVTHPEEYWVVDNNDLHVSVDRQTFRQLKSRWGNSKSHTPFRMNASRNGDIHTTLWDHKRETMEIVTTLHRYENRVAATDNVLRHAEVSKEDRATYALYDYPELSGYYQCPSILGAFGPDAARAERLLSEYNALLGKQRQVRMWILIYTEQPRDAGFQQEALWQNGNKNDLVLTIGVDKQRNVKWAHVFSWTEQEGLKIELRSLVESQKSLDLTKTVEGMKDQVEKSWVRRSFAEFDYIDVPLPGWAIFLIWTVSIGGSVGVAVWCVNNDHTEGGYRRRFPFRLR